MLHRLNGPQTLGNGRIFWICAILVLFSALIFPAFADPYDVGNFAYFLIWVFMALGLCLMWGYGGMLSFGQTFFFGLGGYAYGVLSVDLGNAHGLALGDFVMALIFAGIAAATIGYLMIYGRIGGVFFGIVTLSITLALAFFLGQTAGPEWAIGKARLNGFNGMQGMAPLSLPWFTGDIKLEETSLYYFVLVLLVGTYLALRVLVNARFGNVLVALREDPQRTELLGYDVRRFQFGAFIIGSTLAAVSGVLYTAWGQFITPSSIGLPAAAMPIVWVAFSGRSDLTAVLVGTFVLLAVFQTLTIYSEQAALILMGLILILTVMFAPQGFFASLSRIVSGRGARARAVHARSPEGG